jgi:hypothetical protein
MVLVVAAGAVVMVVRPLDSAERRPPHPHRTHSMPLHAIHTVHTHGKPSKPNNPHKNYQNKQLTLSATWLFKS